MTRALTRTTPNTVTLKQLGTASHGRNHDLFMQRHIKRLPQACHGRSPGYVARDSTSPGCQFSLPLLSRNEPQSLLGISCFFFFCASVKCVSLTFCGHCSCTPAHVVRTPADVVTSALAQVFSKRVIHSIESPHSFNLLAEQSLALSKPM